MENETKEIERIIKDGLVLDVGGKKFSASQLIPVSDRRIQDKLEVNSLSAVAGYYKEHIDGQTAIGSFVHIDDESNILILKDIDTETKQRVTAVKATPLCGMTAFSFGSFIGVESFLIQLASLFVQTPERDSLLAFASKIDLKSSATIEDDGISQKVTTNKGVSGAVKGTEIAPAVVELRPFRTFLEVEQPASKFIFRVKRGKYDESSIECALFEADGGKWKLSAMESIKAWLSKNLPANTPILC